MENRSAVPMHRKRRRRRRLNKPPISAHLLLDERMKEDVGVLSEDLFADLFPGLNSECDVESIDSFEANGLFQLPKTTQSASFTSPLPRGCLSVPCLSRLRNGQYCLSVLCRKPTRQSNDRTRLSSSLPIRLRFSLSRIHFET